LPTQRSSSKSGKSSVSSYSVRYSFSQPFDFPAVMAHEWCTDFAPDDWARMGKKGIRKIERVNEDTVILTDTVVTTPAGDGKKGRKPTKVTKQRLVRLNPDRMAWTNTHITGSNIHSQFWYEIIAESENRSKLDFTGLQVNYYSGKRPSPEGIREMAAELAAEDSKAWQLLAKEMEKDFIPSAYG
jgi:hypothetical protein